MPSAESLRGSDENSLEQTHGWGGEPHGKGTAYSIGVAVRVRPMVAMEQDRHCLPIVRMLDEKVVCLLDPAKVTGEDDYLRRDRSRERHFAFDYAFDENATQEHVYRRTTRKLLSGVVDGFNASCFAYGATGAGKTFTMLGDMKRPGIMVQTVAELFNRISQIRDKRYRVYLSYLEVYNENIRDLLTPASSYLDLREEPMKGIFVAGITEFATSSADETMELLHRGNLNRTVEPTKRNETSSRSHAVLQIMVEQQDKTADVSAVVKIGKLSLIDLAGSERASHTENRGQRLLEGANINRSLLALANCINALAGDVKGKRGSFVPYRDSKLTRLLKDSFGGNTRTVMIANLSPAHDQFEETLNTLKYANRAKNIKTRISQNIKGVNYHISEYKRIINDLRAEIRELKDNLHRLEEEKGSNLTSLPPLPSSAGGGGGGILAAQLAAAAAGSPARSPFKRKEKEEAHRIGKKVQELFAERVGMVMRMINLDEDLWNLKFTQHVSEKRAEALAAHGEVEETDADEPPRGNSSPLLFNHNNISGGGGGNNNSSLAAERAIAAAAAKEFEEKTAAKWAVKERLDAQGKHATELLELARQKLHSSRLQHVELMFRNQSLQLQNMELQMFSRARVKLMEKAMHEMQKNVGLRINIPDFPDQRVGVIEGLDGMLVAHSSEGQSALSDQTLFSRSRRGRSRAGLDAAAEGLDVRTMSDGEDGPGSNKPVALTQDVTTPRGGRRRRGAAGAGGGGGGGGTHSNQHSSAENSPIAGAGADYSVSEIYGGRQPRKPRSARKPKSYQQQIFEGNNNSGGSYAALRASMIQQEQQQQNGGSSSSHHNDKNHHHHHGHHRGHKADNSNGVLSPSQPSNGSYAAVFHDRLQRESIQVSSSIAVVGGGGGSRPHPPGHSNLVDDFENERGGPSVAANPKLSLLHKRQARAPVGGYGGGIASNHNNNNNNNNKDISSIYGGGGGGLRRDRFAEQAPEPLRAQKPSAARGILGPARPAGGNVRRGHIFPPITQ